MGQKWDTGLEQFHSPEKPKWGLPARTEAQVGRKILSLFSCHVLNLTGFRINF